MTVALSFYGRLDDDFALFVVWRLIQVLLKMFTVV